MERLEVARTQVVFQSASGPLPVRRTEGGYVMDFPARLSEPVPVPTGLAELLGMTPVEVHSNAFNYLALLESEQAVRTVVPDLARLVRLDRSGLIVTAAGQDRYDFVSRYFAPAKGIPEDPVTGAAHCMLAPYWAKRLGRTEFRGYQASPRGGEVICRLLGDRVELEGACVFYLEGDIEF
jgi:predicted PhzF superfamily epimerase YddE/YHI9